MSKKLEKVSLMLNDMVTMNYINCIQKLNIF